MKNSTFEEEVSNIKDNALISSPLTVEESSIHPRKISQSKPSTQVFYCETEVIKIHRDQTHSYENGQDELYQHQLKERNLGFSHPAKTWFLTKVEGEGDKYYVANRCPELKTLAEILPLLKPMAQLNFIARLLRYQFQAISSGLSLDLDLSNFAVADNSSLYYIDDDIYRWNDNAMISDFLASLIRSQAWLDIKLCRAIGKVVLKLINEYNIKSVTAEGVIQSLMDSYLAVEKYPLRDHIVLGMGGVKNSQALNDI